MNGETPWWPHRLDEVVLGRPELELVVEDADRQVQSQRVALELEPDVAGLRDVWIHEFGEMLSNLE